MREFPQELVDAVIEYCYAGPGGLATVKTCGLVCQQWLPRSRMYLFFRVMLDSHNLAPFIAIVDSSPFPILSFVQHLTLRFVHLAPDDALLQKIIYHCPNLCYVEADIFAFGAFGAYRAARTQTGWFYQCLQDYLEVWAFNSPSLTRFNFQNAEGHTLSTETIVQTIKRIPSLECLGIYGGSVYASPQLQLQAPTHLPMSWHTLDMDVRYPGNLLSLLVAPTLSPLTSLKLKIYSHHEYQSLENYFERAGSQLVSLSFSFSPNMGSQGP
ncbi:hypothetical protein MVEN_01569900 [Mycena venus]|uniref:Uncharacterized protein n=1 Tax=Mycena venus TaxID=2733690 RepID=A0A8H6XPE3_9AGAR|nr:hypothetical protein MVEN_01569900 [Mycena venus]